MFSNPGAAPSITMTFPVPHESYRGSEQFDDHDDKDAKKTQEDEGGIKDRTETEFDDDVAAVVVHPRQRPNNIWL
ncbi:hypothetical protein BaRGS_00030012 [Batillaria attramentaria]|uniref:Uncharacterized protein n=1 Tax=Batillaria attramentaria TaxID=370345 RepID=A0ABD0JVW2_9CAEN